MVTRYKTPFVREKRTTYSPYKDNTCRLLVRVPTIVVGIKHHSIYGFTIIIESRTNCSTYAILNSIPHAVRGASKDGSLYNALNDLISASQVYLSSPRCGGVFFCGNLRDREFAQVPLSENTKYLLERVSSTSARQVLVQDTLNRPTMQGRFVSINFIRSICTRFLRCTVLIMPSLARCRCFNGPHFDAGRDC